MDDGLVGCGQFAGPGKMLEEGEQSFDLLLIQVHPAEVTDLGGGKGGAEHESRLRGLGG